MKFFAIGAVCLASVLALIAHAERIPQPPGPAYSGFIPDSSQLQQPNTETSGCE